MADETLDEFHDRNGFPHIFVILVAVVVEGDEVAIVTVNARNSDHRPSKVAANVFHNRLRITFVRFCIDIESLFV